MAAFATGPAGGGKVIGLLQRVSRAQVTAGERTVGAIGKGLMVLVGVQQADHAGTADRLLERLLTYRVFPDAEGRMNLDLVATGGGLLLVPQFTLAADTTRGTRPGFSRAAAPEAARALFEHLVREARSRHSTVAAGEFGAHMQVELVNDGPVTFWLEVPA
ncbi:MAG TPA: D-aminoacyl-tRNA deacylase [Steroidobacteraceae bacterium]|nr:D-aminoacyl-tRNA deacylase [Steroidobacteraceae bacterium]